MLNDLKQPAKDWLADAIENLSGLLGDGDDPSFTLDVFGAEIEIRLNKLPGHFERVQVEVPNAAMSGEPKTSPLMAQLCNKRRDAMAKKMCEICGENPATVPDRERMGRPINRVCSSCHALRLVGDMKRILELHEKRR